MTLRQLIHAVDLDEVYRLIHVKDSGFEPKSEAPSLQQTVEAYTSVVCELMKKPKIKEYAMPIIVEERVDSMDNCKYFEVGFLNRKYVKPPKNSKPWGGKNPPKGYYNCNLKKYNRVYAFGFVPWSKLIDTPVINGEKFSNERMLAEILWELTFYGWSEETVESNTEKIKTRINSAIKEIKSGKYIELPPKKAGDLKVVIPDCVSKQLLDIFNKPLASPIKPKKCKTCMGYGLWRDGTAPMGPMDATDGMPTMACPECGANHNPQ